MAALRVDDVVQRADEAISVLGSESNPELDSRVGRYRCSADVTPRSTIHSFMHRKTASMGFRKRDREECREYHKLGDHLVYAREEVLSQEEMGTRCGPLVLDNMILFSLYTFGWEPRRGRGVRTNNAARRRILESEITAHGHVQGHMHHVSVCSRKSS